jgi:hypothetical protein
MQNDERQAGVEIEITEEMIGAGEDAFLSMRLDFEEIRDVVMVVYKAMARARVPASVVQGE